MGDLSREELLDKIEKDARNYERKYHGCSRCTVRSLVENLDLGDGSVVKASEPLAAGIAMRGETCGALLGGLLVLGLSTAGEEMIEIDPEDETTLVPLATGYNLCRKVEEKIGSTLCHEIQEMKVGRSFNMTDPEEYEEFKKAGGYEVCPKIVGKIARMTAELILDKQER